LQSAPIKFQLRMTGVTAQLKGMLTIDDAGVDGMQNIRAATNPFLACNLALVLLLFCAGATAAVQDPEADWQMRSSAAGVFYSNNFDFADSDALRKSNYGGANVPRSDQLFLETNNKLSGHGAAKMTVLKADGEGTASYRHSWVMPVGSQTKGILKKALYYQFSIYIPRYMLDHRFATVNNVVPNHKWAVIMEPDQSFSTGEIVVTTKGFRGFVTAYTIRGSTGVAAHFENIWPAGSGNPCRPNTIDYQWQPAVDAGPQSEGGQTDATSCALFKRRYGPTYGSFTGTVKYGEGTLTEQGNPEPEAAINGITWVPDAWNVVEVYVNEDAQTVKLWHAKRGDAPRLVIDKVGDADIGHRENNYTGAQILPRLEERAPDSTRQDSYAIYDEIIASDNPVVFPGGHSLDEAGSGGSGSGGGTAVGGGSTSGNAPAWVSAIAPGTWAAISNNTLSSVNPEKDPAANPNYPNGAPWRGTTGQLAVLQSWNGGAYSPLLGKQGSLLVYGGGHQNYYGNEVYAFDLDSKLWRRLTNPYSGNISFPYDLGRYPDGTPVPSHMYDQLEYHAKTNSFIAMRAMSDNKPVSVGVAYLLDLNTMKWRSSPKHDENCHATGGWSVYDSKRDVIWAEGGNGSTVMCKFDPNVQNGDGTFGTWTDYPTKVAYLDNVAAYDPVNDLAIVTKFRDDSSVFAIDLSSPEQPAIRLTESGTPPDKQGKHGWEWSPARQAFIYWRRGDEVYEFRLTGADWRSGPWTWTRLTSPENRVVPQDMNVDNGSYGRFRIADLGDGEVAIVVNRTDGPVYAFRVPPGDFTQPEAPSAVKVE
jgi:hypothetical protein